MKKAILLIVLGLFLCTALKAGADNAGLKKIRCTCYNDKGITASGHYTRKGIISGRKCDIGRVAAIYQIGEDGQIGEFIGYFEFLDTGAGMDSDGDGKGDTIKKGLSVDVFKDTYKEAKEWISEYGDYVYIKYIDAEG